LCDVDSNVLGKEVEAFDKDKQKVTGYTDLRKLLENKDIDAVSIATPNHWHALASIWAIQAGKDVYVEKPVSHCVWEGRQIVNAARKYSKIVQTGTQSRSSRKGIAEAVKYVQEGNLGKILLSRGLCYKRRQASARPRVSSPSLSPSNTISGAVPAPRARSCARSSSTTGIGPGPTATATLATKASIRWTSRAGSSARWSLSPSVWSVGGRLGYEDDGETANTQIIYHGYEKAPLIFEVRGWRSRRKARTWTSSCRRAKA
jgi:hypothetical protein